MGWDAFSSFIKKENQTDELKKIFEGTSKKIIEQAGSVDGAFNHGWLDCWTCKTMIDKALKEYFDTSGGNEWSIEYVKNANEQADWGFVVDEEDLWAYLSAKYFLEICANNNLSIRFSE